MAKDLKTKEVLPGSSMPVPTGSKVKPLPPKKYDAEGEIARYGLKPVETFTYVDPITRETKKFTIDRRGTTDQKAGLVLMDPDATREQKDSVISMYLFEKGKEGASMLMDLWAYKGTHTRESRAFQSTMRFDFEMFLNAFQMFMRDSHDLIWNNLPLEVTQIEEEVDGKKVSKEIVQTTRTVEANEIAVVLGQYARYHNMTADLIGKRIRAEVEKRERSKGKGIYIGLNNKPYSLTEDGDIVEVVTKDKASVDAQKNGGA
jgi:hypothetical protein